MTPNEPWPMSSPSVYAARWDGVWNAGVDGVGGGGGAREEEAIQCARDGGGGREEGREGPGRSGESLNRGRRGGRARLRG